MVIAILLVIFLLLAGLLFVLSKALEPDIGPRLDSDGNYIFDERILETIKVSESDKMQTVAEVDDGLKGRGFETYAITAPYSIDGTLRSDKALDAGSQEKCPLYVVDYVTKRGDYWTIIVCNGSYMANPVFMYDYESPQIILTEDEYVTAYDSSEGKFYRTIPAERELDVRRIERIDAETIESLDAERIEAL